MVPGPFLLHVEAQANMTEAAYGLPSEMSFSLLAANRPVIRGTPVTARIDECYITPLEAPVGVPGTLSKLIFVRGALRGHEEGSVPFRLHLQQVTVRFHSWKCPLPTSRAH